MSSQALRALAALLFFAMAATAPARGDDARHIVYLHGRIIQEEQSRRPRHPEFGHYELDEIVAALRKQGFVVSAEMRPKALSVDEAADRVVAQVRRLLDSGVPPHRVTVVGASMGASIAILASVRLRHPDLRFVVLGACLSDNVRALVAEEGKAPAGHLLSVREASDELTNPCSPWMDQTVPSLVAREIVLHTGLRHGFFYRPLPEWMTPVVEWAQAP